jgi:hypothetical protein
VNNISGWKAPGRDGLYAFWWKKFPGAASRIWEIAKEVLAGNRVMPEWFVWGRTVLIPKPGCTGSQDQYRPNTTASPPPPTTNLSPHSPSPCVPTPLPSVPNLPYPIFIPTSRTLPTTPEPLSQVPPSHQPPCNVTPSHKPSSHKPSSHPQHPVTPQSPSPSHTHSPVSHGGTENFNLNHPPISLLGGIVEC